MNELLTRTRVAMSADGKRPEVDPYITEGRTPSWVVDTRIVGEK